MRPGEVGRALGAPHRHAAPAERDLHDLVVGDRPGQCLTQADFGEGADGRVLGEIPDVVGRREADDLDFAGCDQVLEVFGEKAERHVGVAPFQQRAAGEGAITAAHDQPVAMFPRDCAGLMTAHLTRRDTCSLAEPLISVDLGADGQAEMCRGLVA